MGISDADYAISCQICQLSVLLARNQDEILKLTKKLHSSHDLSPHQQFRQKICSENSYRRQVNDRRLTEKSPPPGKGGIHARLE
jgi:hypothetical protein